MEGEPVAILQQFGWTELRRWNYTRCHASREAVQRLLRLADGRYAVARSTQGRAFADLDAALKFAEVDREAYHAGQQASPYGGPGPAVGEWVER